ncbi:hypothetical protein [Teredinibacter purpureus]|uniref:hypothetical protein n=1 Tax=Teredinibacter purpureus TaxID=2731756 RepID=UPI0005F86604|nr:hypothetical protein [Teredinibacter purpureus]
MSIATTFTERWSKVEEKFLALQMREKILITVSCLLVIYLVWSLTIEGGLSSKRELLVQRFEEANRELKVLSAQEQVLVNSLSSDPNAPKRREILRLEGLLENANIELQEMSVGLLSADQLSQVLYDVLRESNRLQLMGMRAIAPKKLQLAESRTVETVELEEVEFLEEELAQRSVRQLTSTVDEARLAEERIVGVYKHAVRVSLRGDYFAVIDYLQQLEQLPWKLYWDFIEYEVKSYPNAEVSLEVYTLSTDKGVLGV